jgi:hypothetical protein
VSEFLEQDRESPDALASGLMALLGRRDTEESEAAVLYLSETLIAWRKGQEGKK